MSRTRKVAPCPSCCPRERLREGSRGSDFNASWKDDARVWECTNCGHTMPRTMRGPNLRTTMTPAQERALTSLRAAIVAHRSAGGREGYEFKTSEESVRVERGLLLAYLVYGYKNDKGTNLEIFCREKYHVVIGPGGGISPLGWTGPKAKMPRGAFEVAIHGTDYRTPTTS